MVISDDLVKGLAIALPVIHLSALVFAVEAIWHARSSQGATAWAVSLVSFPYVSVPLYLLFGRTHFRGYVRARRSHNSQLKAIADGVSSEFASHSEGPLRVLENLSKFRFSHGNSAELLVDGQRTFDAIFEAIDRAERYILVQFFIVRDDELGQKLADKLIARAQVGVRCYFLYDEVGCHSTSRQYWRRLQAQGVFVAPFNTRRGGWRNRFQINFRNHRKIVVIDGRQSFVGGHNVGEEYLGKGPLGPWRDTHLCVKGPVILGIQLSFLEDWHWATDEVLALDWTAERQSEDFEMLALATGPSDEEEACSLMFCQLIHSASRRIWISSPYFVPSPDVLTELKLAALRGVDVRLLLPAKPDHYLSFWSSFSYVEEVQEYGVEVYRLGTAFPHQKVVLVDDKGVSIGTANLDNRSLFLNFEISILSGGDSLVRETEAMLATDFSHADLVPENALAKKSAIFRLGVLISRLFNPIL